jgi:hypothetical protein
MREKRSAFFDMLTQPYQPPAMFYQKKEVLPAKTAHIKKTTKDNRGGSSPDRQGQIIAKEALKI